MSEVELDPMPADALESLWLRNDRLAEAVETALDWIESVPVPPEARRRRFTNGMWAISIHAGGEEWLLVWEEPEKDRPVVRLLADATSI